MPAFRAFWKSATTLWIARIVSGSLLLCPAASAKPARVDTLRELGPALSACWHAPPESSGSQLTVVFSLSRSGTLIGQPRLTYSKLMGNVESQKAFVAAALAALAACLPVAVTPALGGAIAGRPLSIRFVGGAGGTSL